MNAQSLFPDGLHTIFNFLSQPEWLSSSLSCRHWHNAAASGSAPMRNISVPSPSSDQVASLLVDSTFPSHSLRRHLTQLTIPNERVSTSDLNRLSVNLPSLISLDTRIHRLELPTTVGPSCHLFLRLTELSLQLDSSVTLGTAVISILSGGRGAPRLERLTLAQLNHLVSLASLTQCASLTHLALLNLNRRPMHDFKQLLSSIAVIRSLRSLKLNHEDSEFVISAIEVMSSAIPHPIVLPQLTEFDVSDCKLNSIELEQLHKIAPNLMILNPSSIYLPKSDLFGVHHFKNLTSITIARISYSKFENMMMRRRWLGQTQPQLVLTLQAKNLLASLIQCTPLTHITFMHDHFARSEDWLTLMTACSNLTSLRFQACHTLGSYTTSGRVLTILTDTPALIELCSRQIVSLQIYETNLLAVSEVQGLRYFTSLTALEFHAHTEVEMTLDEWKLLFDDASLLPNLNRLLLVGKPQDDEVCNTFQYDREKRINTSIYRL